MLKKVYDKNELVLSLLFIFLYCVTTIPIRGTLGDGSIWMLIILGTVNFWGGFELAYYGKQDINIFLVTSVITIICILYVHYLRKI